MRDVSIIIHALIVRRESARVLLLVEPLQETRRVLRNRVGRPDGPAPLIRRSGHRLFSPRKSSHISPVHPTPAKRLVSRPNPRPARACPSQPTHLDKRAVPPRGDRIAHDSDGRSGRQREHAQRVAVVPGQERDDDEPEGRGEHDGDRDPPPVLKPRDAEPEGPHALLLGYRHDGDDEALPEGRDDRKPDGGPEERNLARWVGDGQCGPNGNGEG